MTRARRESLGEQPRPTEVRSPFGTDEHLVYNGPSLATWNSKDITPLCANYGVAGPDRALVIREVQRLHRSAGQQKRQRLAILSAILSLLILGVTTWFEVEAVNALTDTSLDRSSERWILALVQIILWGICLLATFAILFYLRVRRPTATSIYALSLALIVSLLHIVLSIINFSLIGAWRKAIHNQCEAWRLDIVWMHRGTCTDQQTSLTDFLVAAGIRLLVVVLVAVFWVALLRAFAQSLVTPDSTMVDPRLLQSAEVQEIVKRHSAEFVELDPLHVHEYQGSGDHGELPHMPVPQHGRDATTEDGGGSQVTSQPGWLWGTMAWLLGVSDSSGSHQPVPSSPSEEALPFPPQRLFKNPVQSGARSETRLEDSHVISQSFRGAPAPRDVQRNFERPDYGGPTASVRNSLEESPILASTPMQNSETQDTIHALPREFKKQNSAYPEQRSPHSDSSNASVSSRSWIEYDSQASSQGDDEERDHPFSDVSYSYMRQDQQLAPMPYGERHVVYVEMGDGRLVHRLSTIGERTTIGDRNTSQESFSTVRTANLSDLGAPLPGALPR